MARKRMIDPNIWQSEDFSRLSTLGKLVFIGLFSLADDEGRGRCNPVYLKSTLFPYEEGIRSADIDKTLSEISSNMSVVFYSCDGSSYYSLYNWNTWQKIDRPSESKIPNYDEKTMQRLFDEHSTKSRRTFCTNKNIKEKEDKRKEKEEKYGEFQNVFFTKEQYETLKNLFPKDYQERIQKLDDYMQSTGKKYKDCLATLKNWARKDGYVFPSEKKQYKENQMTEEEYIKKMDEGGKRYV